MSSKSLFYLFTKLYFLVAIEKGNDCYIRKADDQVIMSIPVTGMYRAYCLK